jgi:hypothetical protein
MFWFDATGSSLPSVFRGVDAGEFVDVVFGG